MRKVQQTKFNRTNKKKLKKIILLNQNSIHLMINKVNKVNKEEDVKGELYNFCVLKLFQTLVVHKLFKVI